MRRLNGEGWGGSNIRIYIEGIHYIEVKEIFNSSILKVNKDRLLLVNQYEINITLRILRDDHKQFLVEKEKLQVLDDKIDEYIKEHYDRPL